MGVAADPKELGPVTPEQWEAEAKWIRKMADAMRLADWEFTIRKAQADADADADIEVTFGKRHASIRYGAEYWTYDQDKRRYIIAHELLHCHLDEIDTLINDLEQAVGVGFFNFLRQQYRVAEEHAVDVIAHLMAPHLPKAPEW
jgi:hypothetical protein